MEYPILQDYNPPTASSHSSLRSKLAPEKKLWKKGFKRIACLDEAGRGCERPDAKVLTNNGWKSYPDITIEDKVLSYTSSGYIKWQKI